MKIRSVFVFVGCVGISAIGYTYGRHAIKIKSPKEGELLLKPPTVEVYNKVAPIFDKSTNFDELLMGMPILRRSLFRHCNGSVLEIGVGTAKNFKYYPFRKMTQLTVVDNSSEMLNVMEDKLKSLFTSWRYWLSPVPIKSVLADCENLPFPDNCFDTVASTFTLCSYNDPKKALLELKRVLKEDGKILFLEHGLSTTDSPEPNSLKYRFINEKLNKDADRHHSNWGCIWNRNIGNIIKEVFPKSDSCFWRWHFGTTLYAAVNAK